MKLSFKLLLFIFLSLNIYGVSAQSDSIAVNRDSINTTLLRNYNLRLAEIDLQRVADSLKKAELEVQLNSLKTTDNIQKGQLLKQLQDIEDKEVVRLANKKARIDSLRNTAVGFPVIGVMDDTLFVIYSKIGASTPKERAASTSRRIRKLYEDDFLNLESIVVLESENSYDIVSGETILMSVSETDAMWSVENMLTLATEFKDTIKESIVTAKKENSLVRLMLRIGLVMLVILIAWFVIWLIGKGYRRLLRIIILNKDRWIKDLSYNDYTFLTAEQEMKGVQFLLKVFRGFIYFLLLYITLPIIFSIFPFSRTWADALFQLVWSPFKGVLSSVWTYLPKLFSILVIYFVMRYVIRFVKYIFSEIKSEKLMISGFHADWAMPTFSIIKFLLYAFMVILIFPLLPNSDSDIFKGVSVFIGILFSLGSSSAIANMVAGLVITYMRPFKIGDRIKIGDVSGEVIEKTLLVTRVRTVQNEIITIPNSAVLSGNTTNYSIEADMHGLVVSTGVTIGYDVPWKDVHQALIEAALRSELVLKDPLPFVFQTGLEDFYAAYQLNAHTKFANKQGLVYSQIHQNIQDVFNERGIEIMSPHYRAARDGSTTTIPSSYLPKDYTAPHFNVDVKTDITSKPE